MFDRTTSDCKLFKGSLTDLQDDCREKGYPVNPPYGQCDVVFDESSEDGCRVRKMIFNFLFCFLHYFKKGV